MTIATDIARNNYTGNGAVSTYDFDFKISSTADLLVTKRDTAGTETTLAITTDYTVSWTEGDEDGSITLVAGVLTSGYTLTIRRVTEITQETEFRNQGAFLPETHEDALDKLTTIDQQQQDEVDRSIKIPETEDPAGANLTLPVAATRASKVLGFDSGGNVTALSAVPSSSLSVSAYIQTILDDANEATARATLGGLTKVVATMSALRALATTNLTGTVLVQGFHSAGDGGGGLFYWNSTDTAADNGGTIIPPSAGGVGRWNRVVYDAQALNPKWFGAIGNNTTHPLSGYYANLAAAQAVYPHATALTNEIDWAAIQAALARSAANMNQAVFIPEGRYLLDQVLLCIGGTTIYGPSMSSVEQTGTCLKVNHNSHGINFDATNGVDFGMGGGGVKNILVLKGAAYSGGDAIRLVAVGVNRQPADFVFENVLVYGAGGTGLWARGLYLDGTAYNVAGARGIRNTKLEKCRFGDCTTNNEYVKIAQVTHFYATGLQVDTAHGTGTCGITLSDISENIDLGLIANGNVIVDVASDITALTIRGRVTTLTINATNTTGAATIYTVGTITNKSEGFRTVSNVPSRARLHLVSTIANVTGDGTVYYVNWDTVIDSSGFALAAPTDNVVVSDAGDYIVEGVLLLDEIAVGHTRGSVTVQHYASDGVSNKGTWYSDGNPATTLFNTDMYTARFHAHLKCAYGDIIKIGINVSGGAKAVDVFGNAAPNHYTYCHIKKVA